MDNDGGDQLQQCSTRRSGLSTRSCPSDVANVLSRNKSTENEVFCVELSDDSEPEPEEAISPPRISIQLRQNTEVSPVDQELLKCFNSEYMSKRRFSNASSELTELKKTKISECEEEEPCSPANEQLQLTSESDQEEVIELESLSSYNRNTRLKSNESSSEIRVSSSSKSAPPRPRLKNTVPADSFERYLSGISKKYRELTHRDRVLLWDFTNDVSDVEDYSKFEEKFEKYKTTKRYMNRKALIDNNNCEASCSTRNTCKAKNLSASDKVPSKDLLTITCSASSSDIEEIPKEENILMSINTKTKELYKNKAILLDSDDESKKTASTMNLVWSEEESVFKKSRLNPEIDKISRLIQSNLLKHGTVDQLPSCEFDSSFENEKNFKIPIVPRKYFPVKMDLCQKEEFYKYLGLGTKSPNGKCEDENENDHQNNKRRSLRVRRLQLQQSPNSSQDDKKEENIAEDAIVENIYKSMSTSRSPVMDMVENEDDKQSPEEEINKTEDPSMICNARRSCGQIVKSPSSRPISPTLTSQNSKQEIRNSSRKSESIGDSESEGSTNTMVLLKRSYEKSLIANNSDQKGRKLPFLRDLTLKSEQDFPMCLRNGIKLPPLVNANRGRSQSNNCESPKSKVISIMYRNFEDLKTTLKDSAEAGPSSGIILKVEYNKIGVQPDEINNKTESQNVIEPDRKRSLEAVVNSNLSTTCPVVPEKSDNTREENEKSVKSAGHFRRRVIKNTKNHKLWTKSQRMKILRSSAMNQRTLRNRKFVIITKKALNKKSRPLMVKKRKRCNSEKSINLLSPARVAKRDEADEVVVVKAPELGDGQKMEIVCEIDKKTETDKERHVTKVEYASPKLLPNPLDSDNGVALHAFYEQDLLIIIQEFAISCWKYSKVVQMLGKSQEWLNLGECKRNLNDYEIWAPYKNRMCLNETNPVYLEMRARQLPDDVVRECSLTSLYVNVYYFDEWKASILAYSVQLDTIRGLAKDVTYTTITNSRYFIMCWKQNSVLGANRTGLCKYALTPDLDTLASIRDFKNMRHAIHHLECMNDDKLIGFGETQVTIWDHKTGDVLTNFDLGMSLGRNVGSILNSVEFKNYLFLYQTRFTETNETPELKILAITLSASSPSFRLIYTHELPPSFTDIKSSICTDDYVITTSAIGEEFVLLPHQPQRLYYFDPTLATALKRFHSTGSKNIVEISNETLVIKTIDEYYLMNFMR